MTHTVIGIFESKQEAMTAMNALVSGGFVKENIDVSNRNNTAANTAATATTNQSEGFGDSVTNFFSNLFGDDETTRNNYLNVTNDTEGIVTVHTDTQEQADRAANILDDNGAVDVDERAAQYQQRYAANTAGDANAAGEMTIPVVEENLQVGKRTVETGGVRVRSRIIERPVEENLRLREEHVVVDRRPVDRAATEADFNNFTEGDIEITERAERAVVSKEARVVGEVAIGKTVEEHNKTVSDTVRKTEVDVEELGVDTENRKAANNK